MLVKRLVSWFWDIIPTVAQVKSDPLWSTMCWACRSIEGFLASRFLLVPQFQLLCNLYIKSQFSRVLIRSTLSRKHCLPVEGASLPLLLCAPLHHASVVPHAVCSPAWPSRAPPYHVTARTDHLLWLLELCGLYSHEDLYGNNGQNLLSISHNLWALVRHFLKDHLLQIPFMLWDQRMCSLLCPQLQVFCLEVSSHFCHHLTQ